MADTKISDLATGTTVVPGDWLVYVDISDTTMASTGTDKKLSPAVLVAGLPAFGASGTNHAPGIVPDPGAAAGTTKFLREDATWVVPAGGGGSGTVTSITASAPLTGGNITTAGTIGLGTVPVANGGTNLTAAGTANQVLGVAPAGGALEYKTLAAGSNVTITPAAGLITISAAGGSGGTPGGSNGQIQWNSASAFGGFTMSGDGTLVPSTGVLTIAPSAITYPKIQNEAASTLLGNPTGSPAAPAEITLGPNMSFLGSALRGRTPICWVITPGTAVANSAALTSIFPGTTLGGSLTIPANTLQVGSMLRFDLFGTSGATGTPTLTVQLSLGGTIIGQGTSTASTAATGNSCLWFDHAQGPGWFVQAIGASGKIIGIDRFQAIGICNFTVNAVGTASLAPTQVTINTTTALVIDIKVQWSVAASANTIQLTGGAIYLDY